MVDGRDQTDRFIDEDLGARLRRRPHRCAGAQHAYGQELREDIGRGMNFQSSSPRIKYNEATCILRRAMQTPISRITIDPAICHGKPTIRGLRYPVELILDLLAAGMSQTEILDDYPDLETQDITAALEYAAHLTRVQRIELLPA